MHACLPVVHTMSTLAKLIKSPYYHENRTLSEMNENKRATPNEREGWVEGVLEEASKQERRNTAFLNVLGQLLRRLNLTAPLPISFQSNLPLQSASPTRASTYKEP